VARRSGLGRGLGALIPPEAVAGTGSALKDVPVGSIAPNRLQPREHFDEEALSGLAASVRELGVLQPLLVREVGPGAYELIAGERRWRAARRAGLTTVPAVIRAVDDSGALEQALVENLHREDLNALEEAAAYQQLIEDFSLTHDQVATRVGRSRATITNALRLFQLPPTVQRFLIEGRISAGHAKALLGTPDRAFQEALARRIVAEGLSVRAVEEAVRARSEGAEPARRTRRATAPRPAGVLELEELLSDHLATRVTVDVGAKRGRVVVEFATLDDLERIYRAMIGGDEAAPAAPEDLVEGSG
jgi:ParB family chromosome partitioning protein